MKISPLIFLSFIAIVLLGHLSLVGCGRKAEVVGQTQQKSYEVAPLEHYSESNCSLYTQIRPKVDFLFLWDNSASFNFTRRETKIALQNTINLVASKFDYHIVLAPLLIDENTASNNPPLYLILENTNGVDNNILNGNDSKIKIIANDQFNKIDAFTSIKGISGSREHGLRRIISIISNENIHKGIFRKKANTITVLVSNGNVADYADKSPSGGIAMEKEYMALMNALKQTLESDQFRMLSIVAKRDSRDYDNTCNTLGFKKGAHYINISNQLYDQLPTYAKDSYSSQYRDSYDICQSNFEHVFDGLNQTIVDILIKHVYNFWRIADSKDKNFDPKKMNIKKNTGQTLLENDPNGFKYVGYRENQNTRLEPTAGEPQSGHFIELFGSGVVTYPECLLVETQENAQYYGYIVIPENPNVDNIKIELNAKEVPRGGENGWEYEGYFVSKNVRVNSPTDPTPFLPAENKSGYFIKLNGNAIYSNSSSIKIYYKRAAIP